MQTTLVAPRQTTCAPPSPNIEAVPDGFVVAVEADLVEASRLLSQFRGAGIDAFLGGKECCSSGGCGPKAAVLVPLSEVDHVRALLDGNWRALAGDGDPAVLARIAAAEAEGRQACPACGHAGDLVAGECADCGLMLG